MTVAIPAVGNKDGSYLTAFSSGGLQYVYLCSHSS